MRKDIPGYSAELGPLAMLCHEKTDRTFLYVRVGREGVWFENIRPHEVDDPWSLVVRRNESVGIRRFFRKVF